MAALTMLGTARMVCKSPKCAGQITRQNLMEVAGKAKPAAKEWICTDCNTKTPAALPAIVP
jgi:hypothetical protein